MYKDLFPINWEAFHFLRPVFLWLLVPVAIFFLIGLLTLRQETRWKKVIAPHLRPYVIRKGSELVKVWMNLVFVLGLSCGILAMAGPTWKKIKLPGKDLETPLVIILDLSQSMMAEDLQPNRLERAKFKINDLLTHDPEARIALVGFAGTAHTIVPLTKDYKIILSHLDGLKPSMMPFPGSDLKQSIALADTIMSSTKAPGTILIVSDDFDESHFTLIEKYIEGGNKVEILPINTKLGSEIPAFRGKSVLKTKDGHPVYSSLNSAVLNKINSLENVQVHQLTLDDSDVEAISKKISTNLVFTEKPQEKKDDWRDAGLLLIIPMAFFLLIWFRKGWVIYSVLLFSSCSEDTTFSDYWFTRDYQGQKMSDKKEYLAAANLYQDPLRQGVALYKAGDFEAAIKAFDKDTSAWGAYNLGLAYFQNGDTLSAKLAFDKAVEMNPAMEEAKTNSEQINSMIGGTNELSLEDAEEASQEKGAAKNKKNDSMEDLGGGGQEATKEDMQKERQEETVNTDVRKGKELDEVPDDIGSTIQQNNDKVLMRKVDDDPTLFLQRKFSYQVKKQNMKPAANENKW